MSKVKIIDKKSEKSIIGERDFLSKLKHPFIINMICAFQDYENLYLLMEFFSGGDLRYQFNSDHTFTENEIKFFISCLLLSLEYIHSNNIIHRDIKPENLVFDGKGYLHLTDFGIAKIINEQNISDTSGTPGYMAPEVIQGKNHSFPVDFFAIGVIGYELLIGHRPYRGKNRKEIKKMMSLGEEDILIKEEDNKDNEWSSQCINFINRCLRKNVEMRLGYHFGIKELKAHNWFNDLDWKKLYNKKLETSFIPKDEKNYDKKYCENNDQISNSTLERYKEYMRKDNYMKIFEGYTYFNNDVNNINTIENETVTRVSTISRVNKQETLDNINLNNGNIFLGPNNYTNKMRSLNNEDIFDKNKILLDKKLFDDIHKKEASLFKAFMKDKASKKILVKKKDNYNTVDINKKIIIDETYNKITENESKETKKLNKEKSENKNLYLKDVMDNKNELSPIKIYNNIGNNISIFNEKNNQNQNDRDINIDIKNNMKNNNTKEIKILNIIKNNNSSVNLLESRNMNIPRINIKNPRKIPLNIHNLSGKDSNYEKEYNFSKEKIKESFSSNNYLIYSKFLNKSKKNKISNNAFILPDIRHFNFRITNKKKIRHMYLNQNRIIENNNTNKENSHSKILEKFVFKHPLPNNNKKYEKIAEENYQKMETSKNNRTSLLKSQSSIFPIINNL